MSNCIQIHDPAIRIPAHAVRAEELLATLNAHKDHEAFSCETLDCNTAHWFLVPDKNIWIEPDGDVFIELGLGNSGHTNRDLRGTMIFLSKFVDEELMLGVRLSDEYDGFCEVFEHTLRIGPSQRPERRDV